MPSATQSFVGHRSTSSCTGPYPHLKVAVAATEGSLRSYRQFLQEAFPGFCAWIEEERVRLRHLAELQSTLENLLKHELADEAACKTFVESLPAVIERCDDLKYRHFSDVLAYAHVHFLERYWRSWDVLLALMKAGALPIHERYLASGRRYWPRELPLCGQRLLRSIGSLRGPIEARPPSPSVA